VLLEGRAQDETRVLNEELSSIRCGKGVVKNITDFGAFIDLGGVDGLWHITDMSYGPRVASVRDGADRPGARR